MSTLNGRTFDHSQSGLAEILQWQSAQLSDVGPPSVSITFVPDEMASGSFPTTPVVVVYIVGFVIASWLILCRVFPGTKTAHWDQPWVPAITRRDAAAMPFFPVFLLLPAILWPLVVAGIILVLIVSGLVITLGSADSCFGIPLRGKKQPEEGDSETTTPDLELGVVAGDHDGGAPGGGEEAGSDRASVRSAVSAESERPPPYASVASEEDDDGETDRLLAKNTI